MPTFIYPPSIPWNWMFQRPQQLLCQFSASGQTVLYEDLGNFLQPGIRSLSPTFTSLPRDFRHDYSPSTTTHSLVNRSLAH